MISAAGGWDKFLIYSVTVVATVITYSILLGDVFGGRIGHSGRGASQPEES